MTEPIHVEITDTSICVYCNHLLDPHEMTCEKYLIVEGVDNPIPYSGFMSCPEDNCKCDTSWSIEIPSDWKYEVAVLTLSEINPN